MYRLYRDLNLILWGLLIILFDLSFSKTTNGVGLKIDLINDLIGAIMIYSAVSRISTIQISDPSYKLSIRFALVASVVQIFISTSYLFIYETSYFISIIEGITVLIRDIGVVLFCNSMIIISREKLLKKSIRNWKITKKLFFWIYLVCFGIINIISIFNLMIRNKNLDWQIEWGFGGAIGSSFALIILLIPVIYGLLTIHNMKKEI